MSLPAGTRLGAYEITAPIGAGGMGEVYRARDPRLGRDVAIKILSASVAGDPDRLRRFEQEARAAGLLNHPNILVVHDVGTTAGGPYLVSELLEGETLRARLQGGRLATSTATDFALQVGRGLQAAHERGIVHRDLKPENVFVTTDGRIKILDFGLAKLIQPSATRAAADTATNHGTEPGVVMGTAGYMSPEQVRGDEVDHRTDIFAFGAMLHELLTGTAAFAGQSNMDVMSAILRANPPDATEANPAVSPALNRILRRCLEKAPAARFQSAADLCFAIETLTQSGASSAIGTARTAEPIVAHRPWFAYAGWIVAGLLAGVATLLGTSQFRQVPSAERPFVASVLPPAKSLFGALVVAPDGHRLAFTAAGAGKNQLWVRTLDEPVVRTIKLEGTEGALNPFWSPDSRSLGFFAGNQLKTIEIESGHLQVLCDVNDNRGGTWSRDDVIVFSSNLAGGLYRVSARTGGTVTPVTEVNKTRREGTHRWPHFLPDGRHFLYFVRSELPEFSGAYVGLIEADEGTLLANATSDAVFAPPDHLLFVRDRTLMVQSFDPSTLKVSGEPRSFVPQVGFSLALNRGSFWASGNGVLVFGGSEEVWPVWFDRSGKALGAAAPADFYSQLWLSHDDRRMVVEKPDPRTGMNDEYIFELDRGIPTRFTTHPGSDSRGMWVSGDRRIAWGSNRSGVYDLYWKAVGGTGDEELLLKSSESNFPSDSSPNGRFLIYANVVAKGKTSLRVLSLAGDRTNFPLLDSGFNEGQARFSPDGRWIAYTTDKDGTFEVYVVEAPAVLPGAGQPLATRPGAASSGVRVSSEGGTQPMWRRDGKATELYFMAPDRRLMSVSFKDGSRLQPGVPVPLFETRVPEFGSTYQNYAVAADGQRFLVQTLKEESPAATVVFNWTKTLKR